MATTKLNAQQQRALDFITRRREIMDRASVPLDFTLVWSKNGDGTKCPSIYNFSDEKIAYAGGWGYDKMSTAISQVLRYLFAFDSAEYREMVTFAGVGVDAIQDYLKLQGWKLDKVGTSPVSDSYRLTRIV